MSSNHEENQIESDVQAEGATDNEEDQGEAEMKTGDPADAKPKTSTEQKKSSTKKEHVILVREPGRSLLPFARVQKIIKADKEIPIIARDATFLISVATEEFIKALCEAAHQVAQKEKRTTVHHRDLATVVRRADEFLFLEEVLLWTSIDPPPKRAKPSKPGTTAATLLDQFVGNKKDGSGEQDIIINEDGTMYAAE